MMLNVLVDGIATPPELEQFLQAESDDARRSWIRLPSSRGNWRFSSGRGVAPTWNDSLDGRRRQSRSRGRMKS